MDQTGHQNKTYHNSRDVLFAGRREYRETVWLFIKMLVTVFLCEAAVMVLLNFVPLKGGWNVITDSILLTILSTPVLYWLFIKPVWRSLRLRTRAVETIKKERDKAQMYLDIAGAFLVAIDIGGIVSLINRRGSEILGFEETEIIGRNWFDNFVPEREKVRAKKFFDDLMAGNVSPLECFESLVWTKEACERFIAWHVVLLRDEEGKSVGILSSGEDITERKQMEEDLRKHREHLEELVRARTAELTEVNTQLLEEISRRMRLERELLDVVEQEQQRTGRELHDSIGQQLTGIAFMVEVLGQKLADKSLGEEVAYAGKINRRINRAIGLTHALVKGLRPGDLDRNGLAFTLQELAADTEQLFNISCTFVCEDNISVSSVSVASNLYRIAQEAITNAIKHGKTQNVKVELSSDNNSVKLRVENDGLDFSQQTDSSKGMGLSIMRYRAEMIGGSIDIGRGVDGGTCVTCVASNDVLTQQYGE